MNAAHDEPLLPVVRAAELADGPPSAQWLVESLWARAGVGILGGAPKCCKSWLGLDLALSVASDTPCLDSFAVRDAGPVLIYLAEDAASVVKRRLLGLCAHRGLSLDALPVHVITADALRLDLARDQSRLRRTVAALKPRLLLLDPFVRLHRVDENDAGQVAGLLGYLREIQRESDVAVLIVHHARKNASPAQAPGLGRRGSGDRHAGGDSNLYLHRRREHLVLSIEHRAARAPEPVALWLDPDPACTRLRLCDLPNAQPAGADERDAEPSPTADLARAVLDALDAAGTPSTRTALRNTLRVRNARLGDTLGELLTAGLVARVGERWARTLVPIPASP